MPKAKPIDHKSVANYWAEKIKPRCEESGDCLEWTGRLNMKGFPMMYVPKAILTEYAGNSDKAGWSVPVRRIAFASYFGKDPGRLFVHMRCRNTKCVNPEHMRLLTPKQHHREMAKALIPLKPIICAKIALAVQQTNAKITKEQAMEIRASNAKSADLEKQYGLGHDQVRKIRKGLAWRDYSTGMSWMANVLGGM